MTVFDKIMTPFLTPVSTRNGPVCDKCQKSIPTDDKYAFEDEYGEFVCQDCRQSRDEAEYDRQQEEAFTRYWEGR